MEVLIITQSGPLLNGLLNHVAKRRISFHTPGHKGGIGLASPFSKESFAALDLTELPGLDDLHQPSGIIAQAQANCARLFGAKASFFLVNGASAGIQAAMLAGLGPGDKVLIPRNAHKSVLAGLILSGAEPVYYLPEIHANFRLPLGQRPEEITRKISKEIKAIVVLYPTYYGTVWNLAELRKCWEGPIIADEAHGSHFPFCELLPASALALGADVVIQSSHKNLGAFTQGAMLHVNTNSRISTARLKAALDLLQTTSPSYPIMASLESAAMEASVSGNEKFRLIVSSIKAIKLGLAERGVSVLGQEDIGSFGISGVDESKLLLRVPGAAGELARRLIEEYGIQPELFDSSNLLFLTGVGDNAYSLNKLETSLFKMAFPAGTGQEQFQKFNLEPPIQALTPREAFLGKKQTVNLRGAVGRVCAHALSPYPPGVPVIVPGEVFSREIVEYITCSLAEGAAWQGFVGERLDILVAEELR